LKNSRDDEDGNDDCGLSIADDAAQTVTFNVETFFRFLDTDDSGTLSYDEVNRILSLEPRSLNEFISRMKALQSVTEDAAVSKDNTLVTRTTFVHHSLDVLEQIN